MRRTKIICTLGPSTSSPERIAALIAAGMDVARINYSHGTHEEKKARIRGVQEAARAAGKHIAVMADLQGPKIRVGNLVHGAVELKRGSHVIITTEEIVGTADRLSTIYDHFAADVKPGDTVLLADGLMRLTIDSIHGNDVACTVVDGGILREHQGMNLPSTAISAPSLSQKDVDDLAHALSMGVDYVALSFVRSAADIAQLRERIAAAGSEAKIVAKVERVEALRAIVEIVQAADVVMVARGDLGVELPPQDVPVLQKQIIRACNAAGIPVITATQMLESMITNPRPTRAEASDVANAVLDGSDAVMLSGETAVGAYPIDAAAIMASICESAEHDLPAHSVRGIAGGRAELAMEQSVAQSACLLAEELNAVAVLCLTRSGTTARLLSQCRPTMPVIAMTDHVPTAPRAAMYWGVESIVIRTPHDTQSAMHILKEAALARGIGSPGNTVIITGGHPLTQRSRTNFIKVETL